MYSDFFWLHIKKVAGTTTRRLLAPHFTTHTAPMWDDITDWNGNVLLTRVYRVEDLAYAINEVLAEDFEIYERFAYRK